MKMIAIEDTRKKELKKITGMYFTRFFPPTRNLLDLEEVSCVLKAYLEARCDHREDLLPVCGEREQRDVHLEAELGRGLQGALSSRADLLLVLDQFIVPLHHRLELDEEADDRGNRKEKRCDEDFPQHIRC